MDTAQNSNDVLTAWETSSQYWNKHQALIETMYAPLSQALVATAKITSGQSILDIGGGSGEPSFTIAPVVGNSGSVTYTDPAAGMVKAAAEEAASRQLRNIQFHQCAAEQLPFADALFDAAVSRLSAMFFSDPHAALTEILRVVKTDGRAVFLVWAGPELNPFFSVVSAVIDRFVPAEPTDEDAPTAFRFARPGKLAELLQQAGATSVQENSLGFSIAAPISAERFWELRTEMSDTFRKKLATLDAKLVAVIRDEVIQAVAAYFKDGQMNFPGSVMLVSASKT